MQCNIRVLPNDCVLSVPSGTVLLDALRDGGIYVDAPCGGNGTCGKCQVLVDGSLQQACAYRVEKDTLVTLLLTDNAPKAQVIVAQKTELLAAIDIGTTGVVCRLMTADGQILATQTATNPQIAWGADVVSRIRHACHGARQALTDAIGQCVTALLQNCCYLCGSTPAEISAVSVVGNSCMQQLFLDMDVENLAQIPFAPAITESARVSAGKYLPVCVNAEIFVLPDIAGFIGADTLGCILAAELTHAKDTVLLVDIGTNGEMVLCHQGKMAACATAAGPALEGANISCGMRAVDGAVDHVTMDGYSVIGSVDAAGICGSGLVDAIAVMLQKGILNHRGRILTEDHTYTLAPGVRLTQEDIRQLQLAKGAIAAGIQMLAAYMGIGVGQIDRCILCGAFGSHIDPDNACCIGLLPEELQGRIVACGNLALEGAAMLAKEPCLLEKTEAIIEKITPISLENQENFPRVFARSTHFSENTWLVKARECGFTEAACLDVSTLQTKEMVRAACAADQCHAYGKNWTCPPHCGTLEQCEEKLHGYRRGILLQTVGKLEKTIDTKGYARTEQAHLQAFHALAEKIREVYPDALCLGSGGCRICKECAWPERCRFPEKAYSSMEGYGLFVTQVCRDNGMRYHYGERTITFTACILY